MSGRRLGVRGQTAPIGFILVFAILMLLLVTLQTTAVPSWNQGEEFEHSQQVRDELEGVRENVFQTAATGRLTSKSVQLGARYPRRPFLLNPADPSGRIATTGPGTIRLTNLTASGEAGDYWNASGNATREFRTKHLQYRPNYNEYDNAPMTVYENGVLYDRRGNTTLPLTGTPLVDGERLNLVTLTGNLSESGVSAEEVTVEPVSAPQQLTSVSGDGPVRLRLPTRLDEETWNELLADEFVSEGGHVYDNVTVTPGQPYDAVTISLEGNTSYDLRMGRVRIGRGTGQPGPHYITLDSPAQTSVPVGQTERVTVEVRDRYNNPVSGVTVDATVVGGPGTVPGTVTTDEDGHATFQYTPTAAGSATIEATFGSGPGLLETATVTVTATQSGGGGDSTGPSVEAVTVTNATSGQVIASGESVTRGDVLNLTATATDFERGGTDIYAAEWWSNRSAPGGSAGSGKPLVPADGTFDTVDESVIDAGINTSSWDLGVHNISIRAQDANGNWGPVTTYQIEVLDSSGPNNVAFNDANGNGRLDQGEETFSKEELQSGFDQTDVDLVIPEGIGTLNLTGNGIKARSIKLMTDINARGSEIQLEAEGNIDISGVTISTTGEDVTIEAGGSGNGQLIATSARIETNQNIDLISNGNMSLDSARIDAGNSKSATADLGRDTATIFVEGLSVIDKDDTLVVSPNVTVDGTPGDGSSIEVNN